jgi:hypothetical protein
MADNARKITGALGYNGRVYRAGLENELADAAKRGSFDLSRFVSTEEGDGRPLSGDWTAKSTAKDPPPPAPEYVAGVTFASDAAGEAAKAAGLTAADFEGVQPTGQDGYTKPDVTKVIASKEAR